MGRLPLKLLPVVGAKPVPSPFDLILAKRYKTCTVATPGTLDAFHRAGREPKICQKLCHLFSRRLNLRVISQAPACRSPCLPNPRQILLRTLLRSPRACLSVYLSSNCAALALVIYVHQMPPGRLLRPMPRNWFDQILLQRLDFLEDSKKTSLI
jgi:hypothetical protein